MVIAIPVRGTAPDAPVEMRFARAPHFLLFDEARGEWRALENSQVLNAPQGAGIQAAETLVRAGVTAVLTAHCGPKAFRVLQAAGVTVYLGAAGTATEALQAFQAGALTPAAGPDVEGHW
jgi:predicted Fe-Mo cluster-binding NifX family protein